MTLHVRANSEDFSIQRRLVIFTRYPEPGKTKTRLIPALGAEGAAALQCEMTRYTLRWARELAKTLPVLVEVRFEGGSEDQMRDCFGEDFLYCPQGPGDLGRRMARAFQDAFRTGVRHVVLVDTDCPEITPSLVSDAFDRLVKNDLVLGPATDGGYYLIGLRSETPILFDAMPWGTGQVFPETMRRAQGLTLATSVLKPLADVDHPEDLAVWHRVQHLAHSATSSSRISVIIPTFNEAEHMEETLASLPGAVDVETLIVDAGSHDGTPQIAVAHGCRVLTAPPSRAEQMNAGAAVATGEILLFLHADTRLPEHFAAHVRRTLSTPNVIVGAFRLRIAAAGRVLRLIEWGVSLRSRWLQMPYGDQALFLKADTFRELGGFPDLPIMEDFEMIRRLRRRGRIAVADASVTTSPRRWNALGPLQTTWINQMVVLGYYLGISPERLARWYCRDTGHRSIVFV
jgi:rSAM/selenodomain-associated transferase 2/rSAM/selenodomain-associated transferase 1